MFVTKTIIYEDRVETHYWGGNIEAVPLSKVVETVKHEMAELPPVKKSALTLKADEIVLYKDGKTVTKVLKGGDGKKVKKKELRVEPDDGEEFRSVLEEAKGRAESNVHFFSKEMEGMNATSDESESGAKTFTPSAFVGRGGYWLRAALMTVAYVVVVDFGSKVVFYLIDDLIQPNRPKDADDFKHKVLEISYFTIFVIGSILYHCFKEALNAVPTSVEVGPRALVVTMSRAAKSELEDSYRRVCIPIDAIASVDTMPAGLEGCITRVFDERRAVYVRPRRYFVVTENKTEKVIEKRVAKDQEKGMELAVSEFRYFLLPSGQREEFIALIKARVSGGGEITRICREPRMSIVARGGVFSLGLVLNIYKLSGQVTKLFFFIPAVLIESKNILCRGLFRGDAAALSHSRKVLLIAVVISIIPNPLRFLRRRRFRLLLIR